MPAGSIKVQDKHHASENYLNDPYAQTYFTLPMRYHVLLLATVAFIVSAIVWANFAKLEEVTRADGKVIPARQVQVIQNLEGGIVKEMLVREGDKVTEGQVILRLDDTRFNSMYREGLRNQQGMQAKVARLEAEAEGELFVIPDGLPNDQVEKNYRAEKKLYQSRIKSLAANNDVFGKQLEQAEQEISVAKTEYERAKKIYKYARNELNLSRPLVASGSLSKIEILRLERDAFEKDNIARQLASDIKTRISAQQELQHKVTEHEVNFRTEARDELTTTKEEYEQVVEANIALYDRLLRTEVLSPVNGTVKKLHINTVGGVIQPGKEIIEIVPSDDTLLIEAMVRPADIAFLYPNQKAVVRLTAYDFAVYGSLEGRLEHISADTIVNERGESFYLIRVRTDKVDLSKGGESLAIMPGMTAMVDIITGEKSVIDYLLKPIKRAQMSALTER
ncbi:adhesin transport system membrane fusion protein [Sinobacterium caligoides]|uniref:Membrane fusion protein (MFP) family protein n=2 Tax=Sinobacterium caligoides TaxID=933926 RepID=A0A3N2DYQ5_9GAMM|nr:adhesin transport system membrane fusion protein [Sinobacterium caligoides]